MRATHGADDFDQFRHLVPSGFHLGAPTVGGPAETRSRVNLIRCLAVILILVAVVDFLGTAERFFLVLEPPERVDQAPAHRSPDHTGKNPTQLVTDPFS